MHFTSRILTTYRSLAPYFANTNNIARRFLPKIIILCNFPRRAPAPGYEAAGIPPVLSSSTFPSTPSSDFQIKPPLKFERNQSRPGEPTCYWIAEKVYLSRWVSVWERRGRIPLADQIRRGLITVANLKPRFKMFFFQCTESKMKFFSLALFPTIFVPQIYKYRENSFEKRPQKNH